MNDMENKDRNDVPENQGDSFHPSGGGIYGTVCVLGGQHSGGRAEISVPAAGGRILQSRAAQSEFLWRVFFWAAAARRPVEFPRIWRIAKTQCTQRQEKRPEGVRGILGTLLGVAVLGFAAFGIYRHDHAGAEYREFAWPVPKAAKRKRRTCLNWKPTANRRTIPCRKTVR